MIKDAYAFDIAGVFQPARAFPNIGFLVTIILYIFTSFAVALSIIFLIVSGIKFITASGDEKKLESAKATFTYAIVGLVALILVFLVLQIVQYFLRSNVTISS